MVDGDKDEHDITETKLVCDIFMMVLATGRERSEKEWEKIFLEAGFSHYKITHSFGLRSIFEVYPLIMWGKFHFTFLEFGPSGNYLL